MKVDFHMHSLHSDGVLNGTELIDLAMQRQVEQLSITDHDSLSVYGELAEKIPPEIKLIPGCEFSATWQSRNIHLLGLNLDLSASVLEKVMAHQQQARIIRAEKIATMLSSKGLPDALEGVLSIANGAVLGRPHFAQFMVEQGFVKDTKQAFKRYLGTGKAGDIKALWPDFDQVCDWILQAGGIPVLAHPLKYKLTRTRLRSLLVDFKAAGGMAIEVISGKQDANHINQLAVLANEFDLYASLGSDFHRPGQPWADLGLIPNLPRGCKEIWQLWS